MVSKFPAASHHVICSGQSNCKGLVLFSVCTPLPKGCTQRHILLWVYVTEWCHGINLHPQTGEIHLKGGPKSCYERQILWSLKDSKGETILADGSLWELEKFTLWVVWEIYSYTNGGALLWWLYLEHVYAKVLKLVKQHSREQRTNSVGLFSCISRSKGKRNWSSSSVD